MSSIITELLKIKRSHLLLIIIGFNVLSFAIGSLLYFQNQEVFASDHTQWFALWSESGLFYSDVFFPLLLSLIVAISIQFERKYNNFMKLAILPVNSKKLIINKFLSLSILSLISILSFIVLFYSTSFISKLNINTNIFCFTYWGILGWLGTLPIISIQLWLSIIQKNFTTPILTCLGLSLSNFVLLIINVNFLKYYPYSQIMIGMHSRNYIPMNSSDVLSFVLTIILFSYIGLALGILSLRKRGFE